MQTTIKDYSIYNAQELQAMLTLTEAEIANLKERSACIKTALQNASGYEPNEETIAIIKAIELGKDKGERVTLKDLDTAFYEAKARLKNGDL